MQPSTCKCGRAIVCAFSRAARQSSAVLNAMLWCTARCCWPLPLPLPTEPTPCQRTLCPARAPPAPPVASCRVVPCCCRAKSRTPALVCTACGTSRIPCPPSDRVKLRTWHERQSPPALNAIPCCSVPPACAAEHTPARDPPHDTAADSTARGKPALPTHPSPSTIAGATLPIAPSPFRPPPAATLPSSPARHRPETRLSSQVALARTRVGVACSANCCTRPLRATPWPALCNWSPRALLQCRSAPTLSCTRRRARHRPHCYHSCTARP